MNVKSKNRDLKSLWILSIVTILVMLLLNSGCTDDCEVTNTYISYEPVYTTTQEIRESLAFLPEREINNPGRIYFKDNYIYINENGEGIHVIDNRIPSAPIKLGFINIPGNYDLAAQR